MGRIQISSKLRKEIEKRDMGICQCCGICSISEIHHILPVVFGGVNDKDNLTF